MRVVHILILACCCLFFSGCALAPDSHISGYIFEHYREPYTLDLKETPVSDMDGQGKVVQIKEPFSGHGITAEFNSNAIGDIAAKHGIKHVYWADMEYFNILGIWKEKRLHIYGK